VRGWLREIGFYISDWKNSPQGFQRPDFDQLVYHGLIEIIAGAAARARTRR
jgi:hypothetical protein